MAIRRRLSAIKADADGGSGMLSSNFVRLEGRDVKPQEILAHAMTPPFLAPRRLVQVDDFLDRWEGRGDGRAPRGIESFAPLFAALEGPFPPSTDLILGGGEVRPTNPMLKKLLELGAADEAYPELKGEPLLRYIREEAAARGVRFRVGPFRTQQPADDELRKIGDPVVLLTRTINVEVGEDQWRSDTVGLANELDKLALYSMGREVTVDDVYLLCPGSRHANTFNLADAIMDGDVRRALETLTLMRDDNQEAQMIIGGLSGRYRQMAITCDLLESGASMDEVVAAMGAAGRYQGLRDNAIRRARRLKLAGVTASLAIIVELDRMSKTGEMDHHLALELIVLRTSQVRGR